MSPSSILLFLIVCIGSSLAQISPAFFGAGFAGGFSAHFVPDFPTIGQSSFEPETGSRTNTGPILFPPSPESRDTSGVVVGASGYGFVPPGGSISHGRDLPPPSFSGSFGSQYGNFFHL